MGWSAAWRRGCVVVMVAAAGSLGLASPVAAENSCAETTTVLGVAAADGALAELGVCLSDPGFTSVVVVDARDWRGYQNLTAVRDGESTVLYGVTTDGQLLWHRQAAAGTAFGAPVRVAPEVDWSGFTDVFAPQPGYLHTAGYQQPLRTFRHAGWASGGTEVVEEQSLLPSLPTIGLSAATWGRYVEANVDGHHFRAWQHNLWYNFGRLPAVMNITGQEPWLYGTDLGAIVLMRQAVGTRPPWEIVARSAPGFSRVVVPVGRTFAGPPVLGTSPYSGCHSSQPCPWEWQ